MGLTYFKRYRMEFDLAGSFPLQATLPPYYRLFPWSHTLVEAHAEVKYLSFHKEIDAHVFPCFNQREGCTRLMYDISHREGFLPSATWLVAYQPRELAAPEFCGTIQGVRDHLYGAIQNVGVTPEHRGKGLGSCLLRYALEGFRSAGLARCYLEVTAQNTGAVRLYKRLGFHRMRTVYKAADVAYA